MKKAVLYLRVSTPGQVHTDYDPEGISIPAQRVACERKALQMGVEVIGEYVEPGKSATTIDKRPIFQQMLSRIKTEHDIDYVIVYNLSRLNRNRVDDAKVLVALRASGVTLISAQENIDETPARQLMHGILAAFNEYRSTADGADIRYKMGQKIKNGGTAGPAKLGYLNVRDKFEGREIRTIAVDVERAPFVTLAFELFATGDHTVKTLAAELTRRGLTTRGSLRRPSGPISTSKLGTLLRDRYYLGVVTYQEAEYPGRHQPLTTPEVFAQVQAVMDSHSGSAVRQRVHHHYLKGLLWCGACHKQGIDSRLVVQRSKGNGGEYYYFFCMGRQRHICRAAHQPIGYVEDAILEHYKTIQMPTALAGRIKSKLEETLTDEERSSRLLADQYIVEIKALEMHEENLLDLAAQGEMPKDKIRERLAKIAARRNEVADSIATSSRDLSTGAQVIRGALHLLEDPAALYRQSNDAGKRALNQAIFERLYVYDSRVTDDVLAGPFAELLYTRRRDVSYRNRSRTPRTTKDALMGVQSRSVNKAGLLARALSGRGSSKAAMVEVPGIEPGSNGDDQGLLRA
jgi:site-specific DNA recombinase